MASCEYESEEFLVLTALLEDAENIRKTRKWVHEINMVRRKEGEFHTLYPLLRNDEEIFFLYFRMNFECFDELLNLIKDDIQKQCTNYREPIEPVERLTVTLRFLATGDSFSTIGHSFRMGFSTVSSIVAEVCDVIWQRLQPTYMQKYGRKQYLDFKKSGTFQTVSEALMANM
ncbi:unnamed protein product [Tenebrio molitor]|nr:unnamed protein product [Tenebrio molitor]